MNVSHWKWSFFGSLLLVLPLSVLQYHAAAAEPVDGKVVEVTLYRGQALVTREVPLPAGKGENELVVSNLPEQILPDSLFAESGDAVEIRAVRYRNRPVGEAPREEVRKLDEAMQTANDEIAANQQMQQLMQKRMEYLDKLEGFVAPTAKAELSKGVLDAVALEKVTTFSFTQRSEVATEMLKLAQQARDLQKKLNLLQRERAELTAGATNNVREAVLFVLKKADAAETIRLSYLVASCGWSPTYTVRAEGERKAAEIECNALIQQVTGEDWNRVKLTLSTASPALAAAGPGLAPFHVGLRTGGPSQNAQGQGQGGQQGGQQGGKLAQEDLARQLNSYREQQRAANVDIGNSFNLGDNFASSWRVNDIACNIQWLELTGGRESLSTFQLGDAGAGDEPSLNYSLQTPVSVASRSDQQMVRILKTDLPSDFYHVATPVLTSYVYREAELSNNSGQDFLAGPITVYLDGRYVGRTEIPTVARGEVFVVGFGADAQLRTRRELADKSEGTQGGNRELSIKYRLVVENFKENPTAVRLFDRLPHSERKTDIEVTLGEMSDKLSEDKLYVRMEKPKGILRWEIDVPAGASGEDARIVEYGYTVEYDRSFRLTTLGDDNVRQQQEFEELQRGRLKL